jgi:hypothetical protein
MERRTDVGGKVGGDVVVAQLDGCRVVHLGHLLHRVEGAQPRPHHCDGSRISTVKPGLGIRADRLPLPPLGEAPSKEQALAIP